MTDPTPLSSAAQAVLDAATNVKHPEIEAVAFQCTRLEVAAALRAAADQMTAHHSKAFLYSIADALKLRAIAAELEGAQ